MLFRSTWSAADGAGRIAGHDAALLPGAFRFEEGQRPHDAPLSYADIVHDDGVHADHALLPKGGPMNDGPVSDVRTVVQVDGGSREHVDDAVFLHVASGFEDNPSPVSPKDGTGADVAFLSNGHMTDDRGLGVNIG